MPQKEVTVEQVHKWQEEAAAAWLQEHADENIVKMKVRQLLNGHLQMIVQKLLGFEARSYEGATWELDHCNGRAGNSAAGDMLRSHAAAEVSKWLGEAMSRVKPAGDELVKALAREYKDTVWEAASDEARRLGREQGEALVHLILKEERR